MSMYKMFKTSADLEQSGIILDYGDFRITIARAGGANKQFSKALERVSRPYRRAIQTETLPNDKAMEIIQTVYAESVVLKWEVKVDDEWREGIESEDEGTDLLPLTKENVLSTFKKVPDVFDDLQAQANKMVLFLEEELEEDSGN